MRPVLAVLVAVALLPLAVAQSPAPQAQVQSYSALPVGASCAQVGSLSCPQIPVSHVQFGPLAASRVDIRVDDASDVKVGAAFAFYDAYGRLEGSGGFCERATGLRVPGGATFLVVEVDGPATAHHCHPLVSYGTVGNVTLQLRV